VPSERCTVAASLVAQLWNQLIAGRFGTIKLPRVRLKKSGEKFTKKSRVVCTFLKNWKKLEPINCRPLLEPLSCRSGKLMVQVTPVPEYTLQRKKNLLRLGYA
jgi:hypothetical protein